MDLLSQALNQLAPKNVGIEEFAESSDYCNPTDAPLWMADLSFRPIGSVHIGDQIMGWRQEGNHRRLCASEVLGVKTRFASLVKVTMESGRSFRCTPDHLWLTGSMGKGKPRITNASQVSGEWFCPPKEGRTLIHVIDPTPELEYAEHLRSAAWLGGIFDGEGSVSRQSALSIAQSTTHNPEVCKKIESVLDEFGFSWSRTDRAYCLRAGKTSLRVAGSNANSNQMLTNFANWCQPAKREGLIAKVMKAGWRTKDRIVAIEPDEETLVVALTTSTGNYVCNGYASKNCGENLYPAQRVLLKTFFLEELTGEEEDLLTYWINGGHNGTDIVISPNIRERVEWLREADFPHFREIALVGGRRSSKGFCTGVSMAKVMWNTLQLQDPGAHYGIAPEKEIYFSCIAGSQEQAQGRQYADFSSTVETCKAFDPYIVKSLETEIRVATNADLQRIAQEKTRGNRIQKDIARLRGNAMAANAGTIRGLAMMAYCIDEIAFMLPGESKSSPNKIYEAANPSLGQFGVDGLAFLNSSPYTKIGLFYEKYVEGLIPFDPTRPVDEPAPLMEDGFDLRNRNGEPRLFVIQFPSWGMYEGYQKAKNRAKLKSVLMASPDWDPNAKDEKGEDLWTEKDKQLIRTARAEEQANPEGFKVEYRGKFAEVTDAYMEPRRIDEMFAGLPHEWVYDEKADNPEVPKLVLLPFRSNTGVDATNMFRYKFHLDPSSTTAGFGFAIAHTETIPDWKGISEEHVVFDLIKRWQPQKFPGKVIRWPTILDEVMKYAEYFFPFEITLDQHESQQPVQELSEKLIERNIPTRIYIKPATAELNWHRWEVCKTSIYAKLVHAPNDTEDTRWCSQELKFLQIQGGTSKFPRVDRQEIGPVQTKDMADCVAECVNTLIGNQISNRTRERLSHSAVLGGAEGGYGIGFSGNTLRPGGAPPNLDNYEFDKARKAQQAFQSPTRGALGHGRGRRGSNRARW